MHLSERREGRIDLVISDLLMPEMRGPELVHHLQKLRPGIRVLYMSGDPDAGAIPEDDLVPRYAFIDKPFTSEQLLLKVRHGLGPVPPQ